MAELSFTGTGHLHFISGKMAAGKSTQAARLAETEKAIVISEDEWLATLFKEELKSLEDYIRCTKKLRKAMAPHLVALLQSGQTIVLDFAANTKGQRAWVGSIIKEAQCGHSLHFLDVSDETCLERLKARNAAGEHAFQTTEAQFRQFTALFEPPTEEEGFRIIRHD